VLVKAEAAARSCDATLRQVLTWQGNADARSAVRTEARSHDPPPRF
jgi:hypothetical protein